MTRRGIDLIQGTLELLVLETLASGEARHGFGILAWIRDATHGSLTIEEGALYPALHRMERRGWLESEWGLSEKNRRAKYYTLTSAGRKHLASEERGWREYVAAVDLIIAGGRGGA
jgi:PadR family transcriptional regulator, regulatory protein PadR